MALNRAHTAITSHYTIIGRFYASNHVSNKEGSSLDCMKSHKIHPLHTSSCRMKCSTNFRSILTIRGLGVPVVFRGVRYSKSHRSGKKIDGVRIRNHIVVGFVLHTAEKSRVVVPSRPCYLGRWTGDTYGHHALACSVHNMCVVAGVRTVRFHSRLSSSPGDGGELKRGLHPPRSILFLLAPLSSSQWWTLHCAVNTGSREYRVPRSRQACIHTSGCFVHSPCSEFIRQNQGRNTSL
ncbi:hypothetical protein EDB89DRAFT_1542079 [Lactarius sanguifluus]|nr:hypothetical protein EDB89DRAFT_1542079 [Lactarius sanguifluus]